jgi:pyruvate-ferredoxin/flavodoxin oxidoreductase
VAALKAALARLQTAEARRLETFADYLVKKSVWLVGGDGWAYDIGYGGLDHVLASRRDVNILVMDTEVYSNTGGQAVQGHAAGRLGQVRDRGKGRQQEGHRPARHHVRPRLRGARGLRGQDGPDRASLPGGGGASGPSLIVAYSHCIAHGYDMAQGAAQQKRAVESGVWPLYRFDPARLYRGEPPLHLDYAAPKGSVGDYMRNESRFRMVERADPARYKKFVEESQEAARRRYLVYQQLAGISVPPPEPKVEEPAAAGPATKEGRMSLGTTYLGFRLKNPLIVGSGPLTDDLDAVRALEDAGAAAFVLRPLYEEEIAGEQMSAFFSSESHTDSFAEAPSYAPIPSSPRDPTSTSSISGG